VGETGGLISEVTYTTQAVVLENGQLMRVERNSTDALAGLDKVLAREPDDPRANLYKAIWFWEAGRP
jgi:hypothetical protein